MVLTHFDIKTLLCKNRNLLRDIPEGYAQEVYQTCPGLFVIINV